MSILGGSSTPSNSSRRMANSARIASNVLGTPWPVLWGSRDLSGTLIAWTNHSFNSGGATGKGGGQVSSGEKDYRTFALGLCIGPVDSINQIWYDNQLIWSGHVTIGSTAIAATATQGKGSVILTDQNNRGTITVYFGTEDQTQDPILAQFIPDAPFYRGLCYAVFHGPRNGTRGFRIGNADTLAQVAVNVTRLPDSVPGTPLTATVQPDPATPGECIQVVTVTGDASAYTGPKNLIYRLEAQNISMSFSTLSVNWSSDNFATSHLVTITNGVPFALSNGLLMTISWPSNSSQVIHSAQTPLWSVFVTSDGTAANGGANIASMLYELITNNISGFALNPAIIDAAQFALFAVQVNYAGLNYFTSEKVDARNLVTDILKNIQGGLVISNGLLAPRLMGYLPGAGVTIGLTLEADDVVGYKIRPGAWYEVPQHITVKYRDSGRLYRDTVLSLPGAGDVGDDEKLIEMDLPMVTDMATARLIGLRLKALESLPKKPDTLICGRGAFPLQFGDIIALNNPNLGTLPAAFGYQPGSPLVVLAVRERGPGDEQIEIDIAPNVLGYLPLVGTGDGGGTTGIVGSEFKIITVEDALELPFEWATDSSKKFVVLAARPDPDAQGFTLWASSEPVPVDYNEVDTDALFCAGGVITAFNAPRYTMDRQATIRFTAKSQDIDAWQSVSDNDWFGYQFLVLLGGGNTALLFAAKELLFLGGMDFEVRGIFGPLSDTLAGAAGSDIWVFALQPPYNVAGQPGWVNGTTLTFKGIPFGSRLSPMLGDADAVSVVVASRAACPRMAQNPVANGRAQIFHPTYSADIAVAWDLCNRGYGFGAETNPCEFDPSIASEVQQCQVDVIVASTIVRTATVAVRAGKFQTSTLTVHSAQSFDIADITGLQVGDRISVAAYGNTGELFGRIKAITPISGSTGTIDLVSALAVLPVSDELVTRYESVGYIYDSASNIADNGSLASSVDFKVYPYLNGLRALNPAEISVAKV